MTTTYAPSVRADIEEAFDLAGMPTRTSRWGHLEAVTESGAVIRVTEDDGTLYATAFTGAELEAGEVRLSGSVANPVVLAAVIETLAQGV